MTNHTRRTNRPTIIDGQRISVAAGRLQLRGDGIDLTLSGVIHTDGSSRSCRGHDKQPLGAGLRQRHRGAGCQTGIVARPDCSGILHGLGHEKNVPQHIQTGPILNLNSNR